MFKMALDPLLCVLVSVNKQKIEIGRKCKPVYSSGLCHIICSPMVGAIVNLDCKALSKFFANGYDRSESEEKKYVTKVTIKVSPSSARSR